MSLSLVQSRALLGLEAASVTVEVHLANGLPSFTLVGLADVEVKEARELIGGKELCRNLSRETAPIAKPPSLSGLLPRASANSPRGINSVASCNESFMPLRARFAIAISPLGC